MRVHLQERDDQFMLYLSDVIFIMVPKRAFPDDAVMRDFRDHLTRLATSTADRSR